MIRIPGNSIFAYGIEVEHRLSMALGAPRCEHAQKLGRLHAAGPMVLVGIMHDHVEPAEIAVCGEEGSFFQPPGIGFDGARHVGAMGVDVLKKCFHVGKAVRCQLMPASASGDGMHLF